MCLMSEERCARVIVSGKVQGVCYRATACKEAKLLGLKGWVRNLPDGGVELLAEGERKDVESLIEWCRKGPPAAMVAGVAVKWEKAEGRLSGFAIDH